MKHGSMLIKLIFINLGVFLLVNAVRVFLFLFVPDTNAVMQVWNNFISWFMLPVALGELIRKPWTLISHMFLHTGFWHLLFNLLWLYWFGRIFKEFMGEKKMLPVYLLGGLFGAFVMILSYNIFPGLAPQAQNVQALGASAAVLAIVMAVTTLVPNYSIYLILLGPVRIKYIALFVILINFISIGGGNTGGNIAHLGGVLFGFIYTRQLQSGNDIFAPFVNLLDRMGRFFSFRKKMPRVVYKNKNVQNKKKETADVKSGRSKEEQRRRASKQERIDEILDKISTSGYDSLSKEEKEFLFKVSNED